MRGPDEEGEFTVENLEEKTIEAKDEVFKLIEEGQKVRRTGKTNMNEHSSRSHTIFRIKIASKDREVCMYDAVIDYDYFIPDFFPFKIYLG